MKHATKSRNRACAACLLLAFCLFWNATPQGSAQTCEMLTHVIPEPPLENVCQTVDALSTGPEGRVAVVVEKNLYNGHESVRTALQIYVADLAEEGYGYELLRFEGSAPFLRQELQARYYQPASLVGAVLIGAAPPAIFVWGDGGEVPIEGFFMDMNGSWHARPDGKYDAWDDPDREIEIWVSRIKVDNLPLLGIPEDQVICAYFARNHSLRTDRENLLFAPTAQALLYVDDEQELGCVPESSSLVEAFALVEGICDSRTTHDDYVMARLPDSSYHYIYEVGHASPYAHWFDDTPVTGADYLAADSPAVGLTLIGCNIADFTRQDNISGLAAFNPDADALVVFGNSVVTVGSTDFDRNTWRAVGAGRSYGDGYRQMANSASHGAPAGSPGGMGPMVLFGDGSLRPAATKWIGGASGNWNEPEHWLTPDGQHFVPADYDHVRIETQGAQVTADVGIFETPSQIWSLTLAGLGSKIILPGGVGAESGNALRAHGSITAKPGTGAGITMGNRTKLVTEYGDLRNLVVEIADTTIKAVGLSVAGTVENCTLDVGQRVDSMLGKVRNSQVTLAGENDVTAVNFSGGSLTVPSGTITAGTLSDLTLNAAQATITAVSISAATVGATDSSITVSSSVLGAGNWDLTQCSLHAGPSTPTGSWSVTGPSTITFQELRALGPRALSLELKSGAQLELSEVPVGGGRVPPSRLFPDGEAHELLYGSGANSLAAGALVPGGALYVGDQSVIHSVQGASDPSLALDLHCSLEIASDFEAAEVYQHWDSSAVDVTLESLPHGTQKIELLSRPVMPLFIDIPCEGGFRDLMIPESTASSAPVCVTNARCNQPGCVMGSGGGPTTPESGNYRNIVIGANRRVDFSSEEHGHLHYWDERIVDPRARIFNDAVEITDFVKYPERLDVVMHQSPATIYGDWNLDCQISNSELGELQQAISGWPATYDRSKDANCDGVLAAGNDSPELLKFAANYAKQPPAECGGQFLMAGADGGSDSEVAEGATTGDSEPVDIAGLAAWLAEQLSPEDLAAFIAQASITAADHAGDAVGADMTELLSYLE